MPSPAAVERSALLALLQTLPPTSDTLCGDYDARGLAAHLWVRERRPQALPGLVVPPLHRVTAALEQRAAARPHEELVADLVAGPPPWSPARWSDAGELHEWFVHHEDVRRVAAPGPLAASPERDAALWARVRAVGPLLTARARGLALVVATPDGRVRRLRSGALPVVVRGPVPELLLWLFGRDWADVELEGSEEAVAAARAAPRGV